MMHKLYPFENVDRLWQCACTIMANSTTPKQRTYGVQSHYTFTKPILKSKCRYSWVHTQISPAPLLKGVGANSIATKVVTDYKSEYSKPVVDTINTSLTTVPLNWQILFLFIRKVTSSTASIIDPYLFFLTLVRFLRKWCIFHCQVSWIKIRFIQIFS